VKAARQRGEATIPSSSIGIGSLAHLSSKKTGAVFILLGAYFVISVAIRLSLPNSLTLDEAEQSLFSQYWLGGYGPQPPVYNWVQHSFVSIAGLSLLSLTLPKFLMLMACYVFYGLAAREINPRPGFSSMATLSLVTLPQVSYMPQQDLTHTVAVLMAAAMFLYGLARTLRRGDWTGYAIAGFAVGIGTISKYNFVLLPVAALIAVFLDREWRSRLFDRRILLTFLLCGLIVLPHAIWLLNNLDVATSGTLEKMVDENAPQGISRVLRGATSLLLACVAFGALSAVLLALTCRSQFTKALRASDRWTRLLGRLMLLSLGGVLVIVLATGTTKLTERWLDPYLLCLPLYLLLKLECAGAEVSERFNRLFPVFLVIMLVALIPQATKTLTAGSTGSFTRINYPMKRLAETIAAEGRPGTIVASGMHLAGNMRFQFQDAATIDVKRKILKLPAPQDMQRPVLAIWYEETSEPHVTPLVDLAALQAGGLKLSEIHHLTIPYYFAGNGQHIAIGYAWLR
jgi:lipopolysaccharide core galacturonosyltransferase RgtA